MGKFIEEYVFTVFSSVFSCHILIVKISSQTHFSSDNWLYIFPKLTCFQNLTVAPSLQLHLWELVKPSSQGSFKLTAFLTNLVKWELDFLASNTACFLYEKSFLNSLVLFFSLIFKSKLRKD